MQRNNNLLADIGRQGGEQIAFGSTAEDGKRRWTDVHVWFLHQPTDRSRPWVCRVSGMSDVAGEVDKHQVLRAGSLDRALKLVNESDTFGIAIAETAREWLEQNPVAIAQARGQVTFDSDRAALAWLYGQDEDFKDYPTLVQADTGAGASTVRMQLREDRPVMVPLRALLPFIDRAAFRRAMEARRG